LARDREIDGSSPKYIVHNTRAKHPSPGNAPAPGQHPDQIRRTPSFLLYLLVDAVVDEFFP
jgi:hypothetical protein